jgi:hypothetical protein
MNKWIGHLGVIKIVKWSPKNREIITIIIIIIAIRQPQSETAPGLPMDAFTPQADPFSTLAPVPTAVS